MFTWSMFADPNRELSDEERAEIEDDNLNLARPIDAFIVRRIDPILLGLQRMLLLAIGLLPRAIRSVMRLVSHSKRRAVPPATSPVPAVLSTDTSAGEAAPTDPPARSPARKRRRWLKGASWVLVVAIAGGVVATLTRPLAGNAQAAPASATPVAPSAQPLARPSVAPVRKPKQPPTVARKCPLPTPALTQSTAALAALDNQMATWVTKNAAAYKALAHWQRLVITATYSPCVISHTIKGKLVNEVGSYPYQTDQTQFHHGQERMIYAIMLLGSGGDPTRADSGRYGLIPMDRLSINAIARELGVKVNPKHLSAYESVVLAERRANDIFAALIASPTVAAKYAAIAKGPEIVTYPNGQSFTKEFLLSDLYPAMFLTMWYNLVDLSSGDLAPAKGTGASAQLIEATHALYLDWRSPSSRQFSVLVAQPGFQALLASRR